MSKYCDKCGHPLKDENMKFCDKCGAKLRFGIDNTIVVQKNSQEKSMAVALLISFFFVGLGLVYAGDVEKGIILFAISIILNLIALFFVGFLIFIVIVLWIYSLYSTYKEVNKVNEFKRGQSL